MCVLALLGRTKDVVFMLEQPASSWMPRHRRMSGPWFRDLPQINTWMGAFGASSCKPTSLWCSILLILALVRRRLTLADRAHLDGSHMVECWVDNRDMRSKVTGRQGPDGLRSSQAYTPQYLLHIYIYIYMLTSPPRDIVIAGIQK